MLSGWLSSGLEIRNQFQATFRRTKGRKFFRSRLILRPSAYIPTELPEFSLYNMPRREKYTKLHKITNYP
jgi:hypothetical protein